MNLDKLISKYLDGELSPTEDKELRILTSESLSAKKEFEFAVELNHTFKSNIESIELPLDLELETEDLVMMEIMSNTPQKKKRVFAYFNYYVSVAASIVTMLIFTSNNIDNSKINSSKSINKSELALNSNLGIIKTEDNETSIEANKANLNLKDKSPAIKTAPKVKEIAVNNSRREIDSPAIKTNVNVKNSSENSDINNTEKYIDDNSISSLALANSQSEIEIDNSDSKPTAFASTDSYSEYDVKEHIILEEDNLIEEKLTEDNMVEEDAQEDNSQKENSIPIINSMEIKTNQYSNSNKYSNHYSNDVSNMNMNYGLPYISNFENNFDMSKMQLATNTGFDLTQKGFASKNTVVHFSQSIAYELSEKANAGIEFGYSEYSFDSHTQVTLPYESLSPDQIDNLSEYQTNNKGIITNLNVERSYYLFWGTIFYDYNINLTSDLSIISRMGIGATNEGPMGISRITASYTLFNGVDLKLGLEGRMFKSNLSVFNMFNQETKMSTSLIMGINFSL